MKVPTCLLAGLLAMGVALAQQDPPSTPQDQQKKASSDTTKTTTQSDANKTAPAEAKTMNYKGVLVDMACASRVAGPDAGHAPNADASHTASGSSDCPVSTSTTEFGLKMEDGRTVRFDLVGNQRAQDAVKNDKGWNKEITANKPIHAKVNGVMNGDKVIVSSIH